MISVSDSENGKGVSERGGVNMYTFFFCAEMMVMINSMIVIKTNDTKKLKQVALILTQKKKNVILFSLS